MTTFADLSHHQAPVDLVAYARTHDRVILKATEGTGFTDGAFAGRWRTAGQAGLARVAYHYARADYDGSDEFDHLHAVVRAAGGLGPRDRLCLDVEDTRAPARAAANVREFVGRALALGVTRGLVYTGRWYANPNRITAALFPVGWRHLWLSHYDQSVPDGEILLPTGWTRDQLVARQYTDRATVAGVAGTCDYSRLFRDWLTTTTTEGTDMALTDDDKVWLTKTVHDQLQYAVQAVLKGGSNGGFKGLPEGEQTALAAFEQRLGDKLDAEHTPAAE